MKLVYLVSITLLTLLSSCSITRISNNNNIINEDLIASYKNLKSSLLEERSEIVFSDGSTAKNCATYLNLISKNRVEESIYNQSVKSEYLICDALQIISETPAVNNLNKNDLNFGDKLSRNLDLRSFPSSLHRISNEENHSLETLYPDYVVSKGPTTTLETDDWIFRLEVVAVVQLNDNDVPDWIVWVSDESKSGNYRSYSTLVLYDPENQKNYTANLYH